MLNLRRIKAMVLLSCALAAVSLVAVGYTDANAGSGYVGADTAALSAPDGPSLRPSPGHRGPSIRHRGVSCRSSTPGPNSNYSTPTPLLPPAIMYCDDEGNCYSPIYRGED